jgi:hypothetical protein
MFDLQSGFGLIHSLAVAFCKSSLGIRAYFAPDCHGRTQVHNSRMMWVARALNLNRGESPGTVYNADTTGVVPYMQGAEQLILQLFYCLSPVQVCAVGFEGTEKVQAKLLQTVSAERRKSHRYNAALVIQR